MNAKAAAKLARIGKTTQALELLVGLASTGDVAAAVSVVEILAFQGRWAELEPYALQYLAEPGAVYAGNVFTDITSLIRRAARETRDRKLVARAARVVPAGHAAMKRASLLRDLDQKRDRPDREAFDAAADGATAEERFSFACVYGIDDEVVRCYRAIKRDATLDEALELGRALVRLDQPTRAWREIAVKLAAWYPVSHAQVAPAILLYDRALAPLMTKARCATVLATPCRQ